LANGLATATARRAFGELRAGSVANNDEENKTMSTPNRWVIGNWKMNGALQQNAALLGAICAGPALPVKVAVCAPFPYLSQVQQAIGDARVQIGAQDVCEHELGAYTGQVSAAMLREFGVTVVLVGHSERRQFNGETSEQVAAKAKAAVAAGLIPVICVGETLAQREAGFAEQTVAAQLAPCAELFRTAHGRVVVAYEPVWAIGTGKTASPAEAQSMHAFIRSQLVAMNSAAVSVSILYGGSVKAANARELFSQPDIDGGLIGGASLVAADFLAIVSAAA
jgi:triosephosphate isomerase (TIM)